ncbi:MAG: tetratricopeptide repeat protein [Spirochaetaceae bacterium]
MKKRVVLVALLVFAFTVISFAQSNTFEYTGEHYRVLSEVSEEHAEQTAAKLEATLTLYNDYFRFDLDSLPTRLKVRIFATKERFDDYLRRVLGGSREDFVYLHYNDVAKSELVGFEGEDARFDIALKHQGFIQYFRAFVPHPPLWLREGFAVFFEETTYEDRFQAAMYRENLAWLETLKEIIESGEIIPMEEMLTMRARDAREQIDVFYPQAWGMISFLVNSQEREVNRLLWDSLSALEPDNTLQENEAALNREVFRWVRPEEMETKFIGYVESRRSFRELVEAGMDAYDNGEYETAEEQFVKASKLRPENHIPPYYLGLIAYTRQNYSLADHYYEQALDHDADEALTYYALGVNAYADNRFEEAVSYLERTIDIDPEAYRNRAEELLVRIES